MASHSKVYFGNSPHRIEEGQPISKNSTDAIRGIIERTRGDVTMALRQKELEAKLGKQ